MNAYLNNLKKEDNFRHTENGAVTHKSTFSSCFDLFALGGAYRKRTDEDILSLFKSAYSEDRELALKCLFYLRDIRGGQGERRFFRVCMEWLAENKEKVAIRLLPQIAEFGRWDDVVELATMNTEMKHAGACVTKNKALDVLREQYIDDMRAEHDFSLLFKWLPSINASSKETRRKAKEILKGIGVDIPTYRKNCSAMRKKLEVLEQKMCDKRWDDIEFSKVPSVANRKYYNCFINREETKNRYADFLNSKETKMHATDLNPVDVASECYKLYQQRGALNHGENKYKTEFLIKRKAVNKMWDNLKNYYGDREENAIAVIDVSGSMEGQPMNAAIGMGLYVASKSKGPFANSFITFSGKPTLVSVNDCEDIYEKFAKTIESNWSMNTNIEAVFDLLLSTAIKNHTKQDEMPKKLYIFSDMEFDCATNFTQKETETLMEQIAAKWKENGYELPKLFFWNLDARHNNIPSMEGTVSYISGFSMIMLEQILAGKTGIDIMLDKLNSERYKNIF